MDKLVSGFHFELKAKTEWQHTKLEKLPASQKVISPDITVIDYCMYLACLYKFHHSVEELVFPIVSSVFSDIDTRKKAHYIIEDLQFFHHESAAILTPDNSIMQNITPAFGAGICYVSEGSTLGSAYLLKNLTGALALKNKEGNKFLNCYGQNTGKMWKQFIQELDQFSSSLSDSEKEEIIEGANFAFKKIYHELNEMY